MGPKYILVHVTLFYRIVSYRIVSGSRPWPFFMTSRDQSVRHMSFPIGVPLEPNHLTIFEIFSPQTRAHIYVLSVLSPKRLYTT